jgi:UDP-N-acetylmuramoyl-tripeptide--D-alanyl-D-alanine ligase
MVAPMNPRGGDRCEPAAAAARRTPTATWLTPAAIARVCGGEVLHRGAAAGGVTTDSRGDCRGQLFVALRGERHDGHRYLADAVAQGAAGLLVDRPETEWGGALAAALRQSAGHGGAPFVVRVPDTGKALLQLAAEHRRRHRAKVIGVTGSCGKTSTKEWLGAVLSAAMPTVRSPASFNNQIGVPLTLFAIEPATRAAVVEIGTNAPGEIAMLSEVVRPDLGIVTCVAPAHLEGLGSLEGVAREKSSLPAALPVEGVCILNGDDAACRAMVGVTKAKVEFTSVSRATDWFATDIQFNPLGTTFRLQGKQPVTLPRLGTHNVYNALAVIAAASHLGVAEECVLAALREVPSAARRLEPKRIGEITLFDDTYNMNPQSARAALQAMAGLGGKGRRIVVFGGMMELGTASEALHRELGAAVLQTGQDLLVCVGSGAAAIADGAIAAGMPAAAVHRAEDAVAAEQLLRGLLRAGDIVLCKASRRVALDQLVDRLVAQLGAGAAPAAEAAGA